MISSLVRNFVVFSLVVLSGCALVGSRKENPVIEDRVGLWGNEPLGTLATTAERRIVLVRLNDGANSIGRVCAEPPPDAAENIAAQLTTAIEAAFKQPSANLDASGKVEASRAIATSVQTLFQRTQGLQLYRDGMYNLCQGYLNGIFEKADFTKKYDALLAETVKLIELEITQTKGNIGGRQVQVPLPTLPSDTATKSAPADPPKPWQRRMPRIEQMNQSGLFPYRGLITNSPTQRCAITASRCLMRYYVAGEQQCALNL